jgi:alpha-tubulin suppressor-like RCC1 family protein
MEQLGTDLEEDRDIDMFGGFTIKMLILNATQTAFKFLWAWGRNDHGQLASGDTRHRSGPVKVSSDTDWNSANCGPLHTILQKGFGTLWASGRNNYGQLGLGHTLSVSSPVQIGSSTNWLELVSGLNRNNSSFGGPHSVAVRAGAGGATPTVALWAWGRNSEGQLGVGDTISRSSPVLVTNNPPFPWAYIWGYEDPTRRPVRVSTGLFHTVAIGGGLTSSSTPADGGKLWAWGKNNYGQLGIGIAGSTAGSWRSIPVQVGTDSDISGFGWLAVNCGANHTIAIRNTGIDSGRTSGTLWSWGLNTNGQLGLRNIINRSAPVQIGTATDWAHVSTSKTEDQTSASFSGHTLAIKTNGTLWAWGRNGSGQLGLGDFSNRSSPVQVGVATDWIGIHCAAYHTIGVRNQSNSRTLWVWGSNAQGRLGFPASICEFPVQITGSSLTGWSHIECASFGASAVKTNGTLWAWGYNFYGELGVGDRSSKSSPIQVGADTDWLTTSAGRNHVVGIKTNGTMWAWGRNSSGQLGAGLTTSSAGNRSSPVQVGSGITGDWWKVDCGYFHTIALSNAGLLWAWGASGNGRLGVSTITNISSPVQIGSGITASWIQISCGGQHNMAIQGLGSTGSTSGTLWAWGRNNYGQLGIGNVTNRSSPVQIGTDSDWYQVSCGYSHTLALKTNGTLWSWGRNNYGQLGQGNITYRSSPVQVGTGVTGDWKSIGRIVSNSSMAIKNDGTMWAWGVNSQGELGVGSFVNVSSPVQVVSVNPEDPDKWNVVSGGNVFAIGIKSDSTLWSWGYRGSGRGAIGFVTARSTPTQIGESLNWGDSQVESATNHNMIIR